MVYLYILQSLVDKGYYIGITYDLDKRLGKHNSGGVYSTRKRKPLSLVYSEQFKNYSEARKREIELKSYKGGNKFKELISHCRVV